MSAVSLAADFNERCRPLRIGTLVALCAMPLACSSERSSVSSQDSTVAVVDVDEGSPQAAALADGKVTTAEYHVAFSLFEACANDGTTSVVDVNTDPTTGLITFGVTGDLETPGTTLYECYIRYFDDIELTWQSTDENFLESSRESQIAFFDTELRPCLESNGVEVPDVTPQPGSQEFGDLMTAVAALFNSGSCV